MIGNSAAVLDSPNILHLVLLVGGSGCLYAAALEIRQHTIRRWRLFVPPSLALVVAAVVTLAQLTMDRPPWPFAAALGIGLALGGARGLSIPLRVDQYWNLLRVRPTAKRLLFWVAAVVAADVILEGGAAIAHQPLETWRFAGALAAVACTGMLWGRAVVVVIRMYNAPHVDL